MDPKKLFIDERFKGICAYCGDFANSRDHTPSKAFLDEPYPENLPVVEACVSCNSGFSADEEYLSCLIECVKQGTTKCHEKFREKVAKTLHTRPTIAARIESGKQSDQNGIPIWQPECDRVKNVILKLARGHISYELGLQLISEPTNLDILPMPNMSEDELGTFNIIDGFTENLYPEIGSRAFVNLITGKSTAYGEWRVVQDGRYRYAVGQSNGNWVKFVLNEYLACHVVWN